MKAVNEKVIQQPPRSHRASIRRGRPGHQIGCRSRGCGYSKQSGGNGTEENFYLFAIQTGLESRGMQER